MLQIPSTLLPACDKLLNPIALHLPMQISYVNYMQLYHVKPALQRSTVPVHSDKEPERSATVSLGGFHGIVDCDQYKAPHYCLVTTTALRQAPTFQNSGVLSHVIKISQSYPSCSNCSNLVLESTGNNHMHFCGVAKTKMTKSKEQNEDQEVYETPGCDRRKLLVKRNDSLRSWQKLQLACWIPQAVNGSYLAKRHRCYSGLLAGYAMCCACSKQKQAVMPYSKAYDYGLLSYPYIMNVRCCVYQIPILKLEKLPELKGNINRSDDSKQRNRGEGHNGILTLSTTEGHCRKSNVGAPQCEGGHCQETPTKVAAVPVTHRNLWHQAAAASGTVLILLWMYSYTVPVPMKVGVVKDKHQTYTVKAQMQWQAFNVKDGVKYKEELISHFMATPREAIHGNENSASQILAILTKETALKQQECESMTGISLVISQEKAAVTLWKLRSAKRGAGESMEEEQIIAQCFSNARGECRTWSCRENSVNSDQTHRTAAKQRCVHTPELSHQAQRVSCMLPEASAERAEKMLLLLGL
ncbi:hypothetical protein Anapl_04289 [Anas platyrhynchos]|uniref:Uncharacterized protein n=1 Tax=Anas platyrhynchos TaxID=8839 RepID=R0L587_ANAPL|nr:hypothetical protein Anapl_04289 [Anas platyrhynchos]